MASRDVRRGAAAPASRAACLLVLILMACSLHSVAAQWFVRLGVGAVKATNLAVSDNGLQTPAGSATAERWDRTALVVPPIANSSADIASPPRCTWANATRCTSSTASGIKAWSAPPNATEASKDYLFMVALDAGCSFYRTQAGCGNYSGLCQWHGDDEAQPCRAHILVISLAYAAGACPGSFVRSDVDCMVGATSESLCLDNANRAAACEWKPPSVEAVNQQQAGDHYLSCFPKGRDADSKDMAANAKGSMVDMTYIGAALTFNGPDIRNSWVQRFKLYFDPDNYGTCPESAPKRAALQACFNLDKSACAAKSECVRIPGICIPSDAAFAAVFGGPDTASAVQSEVKYCKTRPSQASCEAQPSDLQPSDPSKAFASATSKAYASGSGSARKRGASWVGKALAGAAVVAALVMAA